MEKIVLFLLSVTIVFFLIVSCGEEQKQFNGKNKSSSYTTVHQYDSLAAQKYGADEYGMKKYVFAFLKKGPNRSLDSAKAAKLQMAHLKNINKMADEGKLVLAGPFLDSGDFRGIYIFNMMTIKEAEELTKTDPAIKAGSLVMELKVWYGSAALMAINDIHKTLSKVEIIE